jgi:hypothetical protein
MSETVRDIRSPEQRVFGNAFEIIGGVADDATVNQFYEDRLRITQIYKESAWIPLNLDPEADGSVAIFYVNGESAVILDCDFQTLLADIYDSKNGRLLHQGISFSKAVDKAEQIAAGELI